MNKSDSQMNKFIKDYLKVMMQRRSNYAVTSETLLSDKKLIDFITECFNNAPSSFNFKTQRMAILFGNYHHKL
jgi:predicted oxidoreductase (fatty acid repression mutant protein)